MQGGATVFDKPYILLKDKEHAEKATRLLGLPVPRQIHTTPCRVLKGELVTAIPPEDRVQRNDGLMHHNYRTLTKDSPATFYHDDEELDLSPLTPNDYDVLAGIRSTYARYQFFIEEGRLDWANKLKKGDKVFVEVPVEGGGATPGTGPRASAVVRYVGPVQTLPGITFGVEIKDHTYFGWGTSDGVFQDEEYFRCREDCGLFVSAEKLFPAGTVPAGSPHPAQRGGGKQGPHMESSVDPHSSYRYKVGDRVAVFTKKGVAVHGTVKWVGMYSFTVNKKDYSHKSVGIETDVKVKTNEVEGFPAKAYFTTAKDRGAVYLSEDAVLPEVDLVEGRAPVQDHPVDLKRKNLLREADPEYVPERGKSAALAKEAGIKTELVRQDAAARKQIEHMRKGEEEERRQEEMEEIRQAVPDQSLNVSGQEERLRQIAEERRRVEEQISGGRDGKTGGEGRGRRGGGLNGKEREMGYERKEGGHVPQKEHTYDNLPGEHEEDVVQRNPRHNQFQDKRYPPPTQFNPATESRQYWDSRNGSHHQPLPAAASSQPGLHESTGSSYPHPASSQSADQLGVAAGLGQPPGQHIAYAGPPGQPSPALGVGSPVQLVQDPNRHGVVRWLGHLPEAKGAIAGVELDEPMEGCGDGEWNGCRYFTCLPGRAFFCPVSSLRPDPRIPQFPLSDHEPGGNTGANPLSAINDWEQIDQTIAGDQILKYTGKGRGIQGHQNSCYLDATIFGLFALSDVFDSLFLEDLTSLKSPTPTTPIQKEVGDMLWKGIVNPLRKNGAVRFESVMRLRNKLEELGKMEGVNTKEKDPEEFLNMLFKHTLHVDPFIHIKRPSGTEPEFFIQLFVELDKSLKVPTIEALLCNMFKEQHISFSEVPSKLLVQVPRYGKQFQIYKRIVPGIKLDPTPLMCNQDTCFICGETAPNNCSECMGDFNAKDTVHFCDECNARVHKNPKRVAHKPDREDLPELELLSVLCIETSHYVCFSRDNNGRWLFFDSMADRLYDQFNIPRGVECTAQLNEWVYEGDQERLMAAGPRELPELVRRFTQDVYMCVYIQPDYGMYG